MLFCGCKCTVLWVQGHGFVGARVCFCGSDGADLRVQGLGFTGERANEMKKRKEK